MRRLALVFLCCYPALPGAATARSLGDIRLAGSVSCGAALRPGVAQRDAGGQWRGLAPDLCEAVAVALLGPDARMIFQSHGTPADPRIPPLAEDVAFLTASEMLSRPDLGQFLPGPPVFVVTHAIAVRATSPARHLADLGAALVCVEPGTGTERALEAYIRAHRLALAMFMFQEDEERLDAFQGGRCDAIAGEAASLAAMAAVTPMRLLPEPFAAVPLFAVTPADDASWAVIVAWTIHTLMTDDAPARLPVDLSALGLRHSWQSDVVAATGTYSDIFARDLGERSALKLPRGLTARWTEGGALVPASTE